MTKKGAQFRPCIDLHKGKVKQIVGSSLSDTETTLRTNFVASQSPAYFACLYRELDLTGGHVIQLGQGNENAAKEALNAWRGGLQLGGGVTPENAPLWLDEGASHVIVTSYIFSEGELHLDRLERLRKTVGKKHLVLDLSCRKRDGKFFIVTDRWQKFTRLEVSPETLDFLAGYAAEFLIHAVDVEGKCGGMDSGLLALLAEHSPIDCVYAGGISSLRDVEQIERCGQGRIHYTIGSALDIFGGSLSLNQIAARQKKTSETAL